MNNNKYITAKMLKIDKQTEHVAVLLFWAAVPANP